MKKTIGIECLNKPIEDFTYEELSDEQQEKAYDFKKGAEIEKTRRMNGTKLKARLHLREKSQNNICQRIKKKFY